MLQSREGQTVPHVTFPMRIDDAWQKVSSDAVFKAHGVDSLVCLAVNDPFVMETWKAEQNARGIDFLPDGSGAFSAGMGQRSWRYSMLVKDGIFWKMFIEPQEPGDPFKVLDADTMLHYINPKATAPPRITFFGKRGCQHCARARKMLQAKDDRFEEIEIGSHGISYSSLQAVTGHGTTPQGLHRRPTHRWRRRVGHMVGLSHAGMAQTLSTPGAYSYDTD